MKYYYYIVAEIEQIIEENEELCTYTKITNEYELDAPIKSMNEILGMCDFIAQQYGVDVENVQITNYILMRTETYYNNVN